MGKGSLRRPEREPGSFATGWERVFGKPKPAPKPLPPLVTMLYGKQPETGNAFTITASFNTAAAKWRIH